MIPSKDNNNLPVTNNKEMKICDLPNEELKIAVLRKLNELQENTEEKIREIREKIYEANGKFIRGRNHKKF